MLTTDPRTMNLVALGMAKVTYGALKILRRHLGDDLDLGLIGFAVVLRTRRDLFQLVEQHGLTDDIIAEIANEHGFYCPLPYLIICSQILSRCFFQVCCKVRYASALS